MALALKNLRESSARYNAMKLLSTNMVSKFVQKPILEQLRESLPVSKHLSNEQKTLPSVLNTKEKSTRFAGGSMNFLI